MRISTLAHRNVLTRNFDPNKIGYIRPDKSIKFSSPEIALEYARNVVVNALNSKIPYEKCVLIDKDTIVKEVVGGKDYVEFNTKGLTFDTMVHGHPDVYGKGKTYPINFQDIASFFENFINGIKKSIVYNSVGEYSMVEAKPLPKHYETLMPKVRERLIDFNNRTRIARSYKLSEDIDDITLAKFFELKKSGELSEIARNTPDEGFFDKLLATIEIPILHQLLKDNSEDLALNYKTNFSNIKD